MARPMTPAMLVALTSNTIQPAIFVTGTFQTGPIYVWTGYGPIVWGGHTWLGVGTLGSISPIEEQGSIDAKGMTLTLSGFDATLLADVLTEMKLGAPAAVYLGLFSDNALIADPIPAWAGRMDQPTIDVSGQTASISIACENRLLDLNTPVYRRYTNEDQQLDYPGDRGMEFVYAITETMIFWGSKPNSVNNR